MAIEEPLERTVIADQEVQSGGDFEGAWVEIREQAAGPSADPRILKVWARTDHTLLIRDPAGADINLSSMATVGSGPATVENFQLAAASETLRVFRALADGSITAVAAETGTVAAAGESMTFDVQIAGATALAGVITVDSTVAIDTPEAGVLGAGVDFHIGELITVVRTYVPGGIATPMRDTVLSLMVRYN
jgi:hypothetical protein